MKSKTLLLNVSLLLCSMLSISACSLMERNTGNYNDEDDYASYAAQKNGLSDTLDELGYAPSRKLTDEEKDILNKRIKLKRMEKSLSEKEREQYYTVKPYLDSDDERIQFLSLPDYLARQRYAQTKGLNSRSRYPAMVKDAISRGDIVLSMPREAVIDSWGEPEDKEIAGNEMYGNERWKYVEYMSTQEGFVKEERVVIFENGKVVGWKRYQ